MANGQGVKELENLGIWRRAYELALQVYEETARPSVTAEPELCAQLRRAAGAVGGHIADGFGRYSRTEYVRALHQARGALMETRHYLHLVDPGTSRRRDLFRCETCGKHIWTSVAAEPVAS